MSNKLTTKRRWPTLFLAVTIAVLSSCSEAPMPDIERETVGGYREQAADFPAFENLFALDQGEDGALTWSRQEYPGLSELTYLTTAAFSPDSSVTVCHTTESNMNGKKISIFSPEGGSELPVIPYLDMNSKSLMWSPAGLLVRYANTYTQVIEDGNQQYFYHGDMHSASGSAAVYENSLMLCNSDHIAMYDLGSGKETKRIELPASLTMEDGMVDVPVITALPNGMGLLYCNSTGVYRIAMDGSFTERLIDSYQFMQENPDSVLQKVFAEPDDSLLLLLKKNRRHYLARFVFDPPADRLPRQEITVYSLMEDSFIRNAVRLYKAQNPEIALSYRVGYTGGDSFSMEDALHSLSIELAAGRGADIIIMDGIPFTQYLNPDTLLDLSELMEEASGSGAMLENITGVYRTEQGLFAAPTRFSVPLLIGRGVEDIGSTEALSVWLEQNRGMYSGGYPADMIEDWYYNACSWRWLNSDGSRNDTAIADDLERLRTVKALLAVARDPADDWHSRYITARYVAGDVPFMLSTVNNMMASVYYVSALSNTGGGTYQAMAGADQFGVFIPKSILAMSAAAADKESAADFAQFLLSREAQAGDQQDGFPVRKDAMRDVWASRNAGATAAIYTYFTEDRQRFDVTFIWPTKEETEALVEVFHALGTPAANDALFREEILAEMSD